MKGHLVSFTTTYQDIGFQDVELRQLRLIDSAKKYDINSFSSWNRQKLLKTEFYKQNKEILDYKIGAGYWLWKPYIILRTLEEAEENDFIIYVDNSMYFIDNPKVLLDLCQKEKGILLFKHDSSSKTKYYTQKTTYKSMNLDFEEFKNRPMYCSNVQIYQKNQNSITFVKEYLKECLKIESLTENYYNEDSEFIKHKHDMSILSLLANKYMLNGYRVPYQYGNHQKMKEFRVEGEFILNDVYSDIDFQSFYYTIFEWDKNGNGAKRKVFHKLNPRFIYHKIFK